MFIVEGHCIELQKLLETYKTFGDYQRKEQVIPVFYAFPYQVNFLQP